MEGRPACLPGQSELCFLCLLAALSGQAYEAAHALCSNVQEEMPDGGIMVSDAAMQVMSCTPPPSNYECALPLTWGGPCGPASIKRAAFPGSLKHQTAVTHSASQQTCCAHASNVWADYPAQHVCVCVPAEHRLLPAPTPCDSWAVGTSCAAVWSCPVAPPLTRCTGLGRWRGSPQHLVSRALACVTPSASCEVSVQCCPIRSIVQVWVQCLRAAWLGLAPHDAWVYHAWVYHAWVYCGPAAGSVTSGHS